MSNDLDLDSIISEMSPETVAAEKAAAPVAPKTKDASTSEKNTRKENFDEAEYDNEDDEAFDPDNATPEQRKAWPKKYANALARRDRNATKHRSELSAAQQKITDLEQRLAKQGNADTREVKKAQAVTEAVREGEPKLEDFQNWGDFNKALVKWEAQVATAEAMQKQAEANKKETNLAQQQAAGVAREKRIVQQADDLIKKNPEFLEILQENADILDNLPPEITNVLADADNSAVAVFVLAKTDGALDALAKMSRDQAIKYVAKAEAIGMAHFGNQTDENEGEGIDTPEPEAKRVSSAPLPMKAARNSSSGKRTLDKMYENGDEKLFEELGI